MSSLMPIFLAVVGVYFLINFWLLARLFLALQGTGIFRVAACLLALLAFCAYPLGRVLQGNAWPVRLVAVVGSLWIALAVYAFLLLLAVDVFRLLSRAFHGWPPLAGGSPAMRYAVCGAIAGGALLIAFIGWINTALPVVREVDLNLPAPQGSPLAGRTLSVAAVSDIHLGRVVSSEYFSRLIDLIAPRKPDMVLFLGDVLDDYPGLDEKAMAQAVQRLRPPLGVWGILGNHEYIAGGAGRSMDILRQCGIHMLRDEWAAPGGQVLLVGRDDRAGMRLPGPPRASLPEILATVPANLRALPLIVLDHEPLQLDQAEAAGAALQLSGHVHGGQLFPFNFIVAAFFENAYGPSRRGTTQYWVSSGAGTWGPRVRTIHRPEILLFRIRFGS